MALLWKSIMSDMSISTPAFFFPVHLLGKFLSSPSLSVCVGLFFLRWVSCRQDMCQSCFLIHSAALCLFIGAFYLITIKVITDRYLFISISPFFLCFPLSFPHLLKVVPLSSLATLFWWRCTFQPSSVWLTPYFAFHFN